MPSSVFSLAVGGQQYVTDEHGMELDTLYDVQTKALRILEQTFPFAPDHLIPNPGDQTPYVESPGFTHEFGVR